MGTGMKSLKWEGIGTKNLFPHTSTPAPDHSVFTGRMPFLLPNQQRQSTEGINLHNNNNNNNNNF